LTHEGRIGNPVGFPSKYFKDLLLLTGDQGAKGLLDSGSIKNQLLSVEDPGILIDLDQPNDIHAFADSWSSSKPC
jgi:molybdenum cofactor cytidylyltransferase